MSAKSGEGAADDGLGREGPVGGEMQGRPAENGPDAVFPDPVEPPPAGPNLTRNIFLRAVSAIFSNGGDTFWLYVLALGAAFVVGLIYAVTSPSGGDTETVIFVSTLASCLVFLWPCVKRLNLAFGVDPLPRSLAVAIMIGLVLLAVKWWLKVTLIGDTGEAYGWAFIAAVAVIAPVAEESFFRGYLWRTYLARGYDEKAVLLAVSLLFMVAHLPMTPDVQLEYAFMSLSLGLVRYYAGSVYPGIVFHSLMNLIVLYAH